MNISKILKKCLMDRNIDLSQHKPQYITVGIPVFSLNDTFTKNDLEDDGYYEIEDDFPFDEYTRVIHYVTRLETYEELGCRLCREYDNIN